MKNLIVFTGSCGHVTFTEVDDEKFERLVAPRTVKTILGDKMFTNPTRIGRSTRAVYIQPHRFTLCMDCIRAFGDAP